MLLPQNICRRYSTSSLHGTWHGHKRRRTWASFSDMPLAPLNYLTINYDSINQKFSSINVAQNKFLRTQWLISNHFLRSDSIHVQNVFKSARDEMKRLNKGRRARSHDTQPLNSSFGSYCCLCWEQRGGASKLLADKFECQNRKQPSEVNFKPQQLFSSDEYSIN